jgi:hypothetical protein
MALLSFSAPAFAARLELTVPIPDDPVTVKPGVEGDRLEVPGADWRLRPTPAHRCFVPYGTHRAATETRKLTRSTSRFRAGAVAAAFKPVAAGPLVGTEGEIIKADPSAVHAARSASSISAPAR